MSTDICTTKIELAAIFPQHNQETITDIYNNVIENSHENIQLEDVLPLCIERLLALPIEGNIGRGKNGDDIHIDIDNDHLIFNEGTSVRDFNSSLNNERQRNNGAFDKKPLANYRKDSPSVPSSSFLYLSDEGESVFSSTKINNIKKIENKRLSEESDLGNSPLCGHKRKLNGLDSSMNELNGLGHHKSRQMYKKDQRLPSSISSSSSNRPDDHEVSIVSEDVDVYLDICKKKVKTIINNVDDYYLETLINKQSRLLPVPEVVNSVIEYLFEHEDYPKIDFGETSTLSISTAESELEDDQKNIQSYPSTSASSLSSASCTSSSDSLEYNKQAVILLQNNFPKISTNIIRNIFQKNKNYTEAFNEINTAFEKVISGEMRLEDSIIKTFLRKQRNKINITDVISTLTDEITLIEESKKKGENKTNGISTAAKDDQYAVEGQAIECGCCYNVVAFEDMVQCIEGHLFCAMCLQNYSKEAIYGTGKVQLFCMTSGCNSTFPMSQLKKALHGDMIEKYMERLQNEDIRLANIDNLVKCPGCEFAAEMDEADKVFSCQNPSCMKESCRYCKEDWNDHFGLPCKEVEKKDVTNLRTTYEEKMTQAKVRKCWQCSTIFLKSDGCNKMTCRCGAKMCYICRERSIDYKHFCQHPRNPGSDCKKCKNCSLWTDPSEDDDRAIAEIKKQAEEEGRKLGDEGHIPKIGPSPTRINTDKINNGSIQCDDGEYYGSSEDESDDDDDSSVSSDSDSSRNFSGYDSMDENEGMFGMFHEELDHDQYSMELDTSSDSDI